MLLWIIICHLVATSMKFVRNKINRTHSEISLDRLVNALVISRLDYCNCLLYGIPKYQRDKLQRIQNTAARLVMGLKRSDHVTPILKNLHCMA